MLSQEALNLVTQMVWDTPGEEWTPRDFLDHSSKERATPDNFHKIDVKHFCAAVVHPKTGETMTQYKRLTGDVNPELRETWQTGSGKELGHLAQGDNKAKTKGKKLHLCNEPRADCEDVRGR